MSIKKILITGGSGFIGTNLVRFLINKNIEVHNIDKMSYCSVPNKFTNFSKKKYFFYKVYLLKIHPIKTMYSQTNFFSNKKMNKLYKNLKSQ